MFKSYLKEYRASDKCNENNYEEQKERKQNQTSDKFLDNVLENVDKKKEEIIVDKDEWKRKYERDITQDKIIENIELKKEKIFDRKDERKREYERDITLEEIIENSELKKENILCRKGESIREYEGYITQEEIFENSEQKKDEISSDITDISGIVNPNLSSKCVEHVVFPDSSDNNKIDKINTFLHPNSFTSSRYSTPIMNCAPKSDEMEHTKQIERKIRREQEYFESWADIVTKYPELHEYQARLVWDTTQFSALRKQIYNLPSWEEIRTLRDSIIDERINGNDIFSKKSMQIFSDRIKTAYEDYGMVVTKQYTCTKTSNLQMKTVLEDYKRKSQDSRPLDKLFGLFVPFYKKSYTYYEIPWVLALELNQFGLLEFNQFSSDMSKIILKSDQKRKFEIYNERFSQLLDKETISDLYSDLIYSQKNRKTVDNLVQCYELVLSLVMVATSSSMKRSTGGQRISPFNTLANELYHNIEDYTHSEEIIHKFRNIAKSFSSITEDSSVINLLRLYCNLEQFKQHWNKLGIKEDDFINDKEKNYPWFWKLFFEIDGNSKLITPLGINYPFSPIKNVDNQPLWYQCCYAGTGFCIISDLEKTFSSNMEHIQSFFRFSQSESLRKSIKTNLEKIQEIYDLLGLEDFPHFRKVLAAENKYKIPPKSSIPHTQIAALINLIHENSVLPNLILLGEAGIPNVHCFPLVTTVDSIETLVYLETAVKIFIQRYWNGNMDAFNAWIDESIMLYLSQPEKIKQWKNETTGWFTSLKDFLNNPALDFRWIQEGLERKSGTQFFKSSFSYKNEVLKGNIEKFLSSPERSDIESLASSLNTFFVCSHSIISSYCSSHVPKSKDTPFAIVHHRFPLISYPNENRAGILHNAFFDSIIFTTRQHPSKKKQIVGFYWERLGGWTDQTTYQWEKTIETPHAILSGYAPFFIVESKIKLDCYSRFNDLLSLSGYRYAASIGIIAPAVTEEELDYLIVPLCQNNFGMDPYDVLTQLHRKKTNGSPLLNLHNTPFIEETTNQMKENIVNSFQARFGIIPNGDGYKYIKTNYHYFNRETQRLESRDDWWKIYWSNYLNMGWLAQEVLFAHWKDFIWDSQIKTLIDVQNWLNSFFLGQHRRKYADPPT